MRLAALLLAAALPATAQVHHRVDVRIEPALHRIEGTDTLTVPPDRRSVPLAFRMHSGLDVRAASDAWTVREAKQQPAMTADAEEQGLQVPTTIYEASPAGGAWPEDGTLPLRFGGVIDHPIQSGAEEYARSFAQTPGTIGEDGVVLSGSTWWLPVLGAEDDHELFTFTLTADVPGDWDVVSQGARTAHRLSSPADAKTSSGEDATTPSRMLVTWDCPHPMDEAYLVAAKFFVTQRQEGGVTTQAFLRERDDALAAKYLDATAQYLGMYDRLLGKYPFEKFALVENAWETGYGMPSFTLLGSQVIRLPFILHSSYPHEILHNWWGNSVYVDWPTGNWCEGLTAYLADHLIREGQGRGAEYRRDTLKAYGDYVSAAKDFPLADFRSRHSSATQAVGYGKCLMLWHALRLELGEETFVAALRELYERRKFTVTSWSDIEAIVSTVAARDMKAFFQQWTQRTGAPTLALSVKPEGPDLVVGVRQMQRGEPFMGLIVPAALTSADGSARLVTLKLDGPDASLRVPAADIVRVDLDPEADVFRRLDRAETPPTLSEIFGAEHVTLVVPAEGSALAAEWRAFADTWAAGGKDVVIVSEANQKTLPADRATWVLGSGNALGPAVLKEVAVHGATVSDDDIRFGAETVQRVNRSFVMVARNPRNPALAAGWIGADLAAALPGLARKLPHYGKYSYLAFQGTAPDNVVKGSWPATGSPLVAFVGEGERTRPPRGTLKAREPLAKLAPVFDSARLAASVAFLADDAREGRGIGTAGLEQSAEFIAKAFADAGLKPGGPEGSWFDSWTESDGPGDKPATLKNVIGILPGTNPAFADQCVVIGAHYDHLGLGGPGSPAWSMGKIHNGADDNASGVAVLIEVARELAADSKPERGIVFVAFSGEERGLKGSRRFVTTRVSPKPFAMVNLDTVGRLEGKPVIVLGAGSATEWRHIAMGIGYTTGVESTVMSDDPGGSDQVAFQEAGIPAVQLFTGPHGDYHRPSDDADKVDVGGLAKVATWVREAAEYLAARPEPLTAGGAKPARAGGASTAGTSGAPPSRRVSLGTMPDFTFKERGVRIEAVTAGSPAEAAGLAAGDVLLALDGAEIADLRGYSDLLKAHQPGDTVRIRYRRGTQELETKATLGAR